MANQWYEIENMCTRCIVEDLNGAPGDNAASQPQSKVLDRSDAAKSCARYATVVRTGFS